MPLEIKALFWQLFIEGFVKFCSPMINEGLFYRIEFL